MALSYPAAETLYESRRNDGRTHKRYSHNQQIEYDRFDDCYLHRHHNTVTVRIYRDKYRLNTGGWDTVTTWKKINDVANPPWLYKGRAGIPTTAIEKRFLGREGRFSPYFDGIEFSGAYVLNPIPYTRRRVRRGAAKEFTALRKGVLARIGTRVAIGEFDEKPTDGFLLDEQDDSDADNLPDGEQLWGVMERIMGCTPGVWIEPWLLKPLFVRRPRCVFARRRVRWVIDNRPRTGAQLLQSSLGVVLRHYHQVKGSYETIEVKGYDE